MATPQNYLLGDSLQKPDGSQPVVSTTNWSADTKSLVLYLYCDKTPSFLGTALFRTTPGEHLLA